jgi:Ribbon-helix-helix protein, copG family
VIEATSGERKPNAKAPKKQSAKAPKRQSAPEAIGEGATLKVSVYLTQNDLDGLDQQVIASRPTSGKKRDRSELIREAVRTWLKTQR